MRGPALPELQRPSTRGGNVNQDTTYLFINAGNNGVYWSSTPNSNGTQAYNLNFWGTSDLYPSNNNNRNNGFSVRCLCRARSPSLNQQESFNQPPQIVQKYQNN